MQIIGSAHRNNQTKVALVQVQSAKQSIPISTTQDLQTISDSQLYGLCKEYGKSARKWMREFGFLLPEVYRRRLYRKYRCTSIHMFAAKLASMNYDVTSRILNLSEKLKDMPLLWQEFRRFGWTKLAVVANIVVSETENFWLDKLRKMPKAALIEYVRQWRNINNKNYNEIGPKNNLFDLVPYKNPESKILGSNKPLSAGTLKLGNEITDKDVATNIDGKVTNVTENLTHNLDLNSEARPSFKKLKFRVDPETEFEFKKFKQKLEKERKVALTMGETLKALLKKVKELEDSGEKIKVQVAYTHGIGTAKNPTVSRHIPNQQKRSIINQYNGKCAFPGCNEPYFELHHPNRFSIHRSHEKIYPLCKIHHQAAHVGLIKNEDKPIEQWRLNVDGDDCKKIDQNKNLDYIVDSKNLNSVYAAYDKFRKNFADARVREYFDG